MQISKICIFAVCALTLAFLKVSIRVCGVCMEHVACPFGHFTPLRNAIQSICQRSKSYVFLRLCVQYIAPWDSGNSATMSFRNLHVYYGGSYGSHNIAIYIGHRRSTYIYIYDSRSKPRSKAIKLERPKIRLCITTPPNQHPSKSHGPGRETEEKRKSKRKLFGECQKHRALEEKRKVKRKHVLCISIEVT